MSNRNQAIEIACRIVGAIAGAGMLAIAVAGWHLWKFDGGVSVILGLIGICFIGAAVKTE